MTKRRSTTKTVPEVFIIESLSLDDEKDRREGKILFEVLKLAGRKPIYRYIRTKAELEHFIEEFEESNYRYLHFSSHANKKVITLTLDEISHKEFGELVGAPLKGRRLFLSACEVATDALAKEVLADTGCFSMSGPTKAIRFDDAIVLWSAFYHLMHKENPERMLREAIIRNMTSCAKLINEEIAFFTLLTSGKIKTRSLK